MSDGGVFPLFPLFPPNNTQPHIHDRAQHCSPYRNRPLLRFQGALSPGPVQRATTLNYVRALCNCMEGAIFRENWEQWEQDRWIADRQSVLAEGLWRTADRDMIRYQPSAISHQPSAISRLPTFQRIRQEAWDVERSNVQTPFASRPARVMKNGARLAIVSMPDDCPCGVRLAMPLSSAGPNTRSTYRRAGSGVRWTLRSGRSASRVRLGAVAPAVFPAEHFDLYPAARRRVIRPQGGAGLPQRLPDANCLLGRRRCPGLRRSFPQG
jgi:hypothetical protein